MTLEKNIPEVHMYHLHSGIASFIDYQCCSICRRYMHRVTLKIKLISNPPPHPQSWYLLPYHLALHNIIVLPALVVGNVGIC